DAGENAFHLLLVGDAVVAAERLELRDVGAGDEGLAAGSAKHRCAQPIFPADLRASLAELLIHAPGHGVARGRPVEDHRGDLAVASVAHLPIGHRTAPNVATAIFPHHGRMRRLISLITALLSKSPSPCRTQASKTSAWISSSGSRCFSRSACSSMRWTSLR